MKKTWFVVSALALVFAGILMMSCPSEAELTPMHYVKGNIVLEGQAEYDYEFETDELDNIKGNLVNTSGKFYIVTLNAADLDSTLHGCHFQGQLFYEYDDTRYLFSASVDAIPNVVIDKKNTIYRFVFEAGNMGTIPATPPTDYEYGEDDPVPAGAKVIFKLVAKAPNWYSIGIPQAFQDDNGNGKHSGYWEGAYYDDPDKKYKIAGEIAIMDKPSVGYLPGDLITYVPDADVYGPRGKGNIEGEQFQKLKDAPKGSVLVLDCEARHVDTTSNTSGIGGGSNPATDATKPGWGIGSFGPTTTKVIRSQNIELGISVPTNATSGANSWTMQILIDDILAFSEDELVFINVNNGGKINSMQIFTEIPLEPDYSDLLEMLDRYDLTTLKKLLDLLYGYDLDRLEQILDDLLNSI